MTNRMYEMALKHILGGDEATANGAVADPAPHGDRHGDTMMKLLERHNEILRKLKHSHEAKIARLEDRLARVDPTFQRSVDPSEAT